jgi:hypothetical protein
MHDMNELELAREHLLGWDARLAIARGEVRRLEKHREACLSNIQRMQDADEYSASEDYT